MGRGASPPLPGSLTFPQGINLQGELLLCTEGRSGLGGERWGQTHLLSPGESPPIPSRSCFPWGNAKLGLGLIFPQAKRVFEASCMSSIWDLVETSLEVRRARREGRALV